jgi:hypothetical protein
MAITEIEGGGPELSGEPVAPDISKVSELGMRPFPSDIDLSEVSKSSPDLREVKLNPLPAEVLPEPAPTPQPVPELDLPDEPVEAAEPSEPEPEAPPIETATPAERAKALVDEAREADTRNIARSEPVDITAQESAPTEATLATEQDKMKQQARTMIQDEGLAENMARTIDKGRDEAAQLQAKAAETLATIKEVQEQTEAQVGPNERLAKHYSDIDKPHKAKYREDRAEMLRQRGAAKIEALDPDGTARNADQLAGEITTKAEAEAEDLKTEWDKEKSKDYENDPEVAYTAAYAEKGPREQAMAVEKAAERFPEGHRERARLDTLANELRQKGLHEGAEAGEAERARMDAADAAVNAQVMASSDQLRSIISAAEAKSIPSIGVNKDKTTAEVEALATTLQTSFGVDLRQPPLDAVKRGGRIFGKKFVDIYRQSNEPAYRNIVFIERYDRKTGQIVRLDAVSAPRQPKPDIKSGKDKLGRIAENRWRISERKWRKAIDEELENRQTFNKAPDAANPFLPGNYNSEQQSRGEIKGADYSYTDILTRSGMDSEQAKQVRKPRRLGWWLSLFGG